MKKLLLMVAVAVAVVLALVSAWAVHRDYYRHAAPPPGWAIVCDGQGHFGARFPHSSYVIADDYDANALTSRQQAINRAWAHQEWEDEQNANPQPPPPKHGEWQDCDR